MKSRALALLLVLALLPAAPSVAAAQTNDPTQSAAAAGAQDWQDLQDLKPGTRVLVKFKPHVSDDPADGRFVSVIGTKLTLTTEGYTRSLEQRDIQSVYRLKGGWSRHTMARIGAVVGAVVGGYLDAKYINPIDRPITPTDDGTPSVAGFVFGGLAGAGAGALLGGKRKGKLLYEAK